MANQLVTLRSVSWRDCCPWLIIVGAFRLAISPQLLTFATLGVLLTNCGWWVFGELLDPGVDRPDRLPPRASWVSSVETNVAEDSSQIAVHHKRGIWQSVAQGPVLGVWYRMNGPYMRLLTGPSAGWRTSLFYLVGAFWTLLVWSWFGAAITRCAALRLAVDERPSFSQLFSYCASKFVAHLRAPLVPLLPVAALSVVILATVGILARGEITLWLAGLLWGPALALAFMMAALLLGLAIGWPLMWCTISTEGTDEFDALSRSYSYTFRCPLHYAFYSLVAAVLGTLGLILVEFVADWAVHFCSWSASWTAGWNRVVEITGGTVGGTTSSSGSGATLIKVWIGLVRTLESAFSYSFFWTSITAIYLLLRYHVDHTELDEVYLTPQDETYGLPPLNTDEAGVPRVADEPGKEDA
ncbi:MAG: hypothetical protein MK179_00085 [Pirellulaceae bacterium]|nr:hypothetical protein [Pirellulaceae bacterium]